MFALDLQRIIDRALEQLWPEFAEARCHVWEETRRFLQRLSGLENLAFDG